MNEQEKKQKFIQRYLLYPTVALIGVVIVYLIFASPSTKEPKAQSEFNVTVPEAVEEELAESKKSAYVEEQTKQEEADRETIKTLAEKMASEKREVAVVTPKEKVVASTEAYRNMNRSVGAFYTPPKVDPEKEQLQKELDELRSELAKRQAQPTMGVDEQIALMEKSYELAAKYSSNGQEVPQQAATPAAEYVNGMAQVNSVVAVASAVVSSLGSANSSAGFNTAVGGTHIEERNTIAAVVHSDQSVTNGAAVRLRLVEPMQVGDKLLPRNSCLTGIARVQGERLHVAISNVEYRGYILPVEIVVMDGDGVEGILVPNSMEVSALKSIVANMSGSASSSITIADQSAGDQVLTELGTSAIDGVTQYVADKVKEVKVHLKAGHRVMLYQKIK